MTKREKKIIITKMLLAFIGTAVFYGGMFASYLVR